MILIHEITKTDETTVGLPETKPDINLTLYIKKNQPEPTNKKDTEQVYNESKQLITSLIDVFGVLVANKHITEIARGLIQPEGSPPTDDIKICDLSLPNHKYQNPDISKVVTLAKKQILKNNHKISIPFELADISFKMSEGGLLGTLPTPNFFQGDLVELDGVSWAPTIIKSLASPTHIPSFNSTINDLVDKRASDPDNAKMWKLLANTTIGMLGNKAGGDATCRRTYLTYTLTGQLHLLKLIDMCLSNNITVISTCTDAITIINNDNSILQKITTEWTEITGIQLTQDQFSVIARNDLQGYAARRFNGDIKSKGSLKEHGSLLLDVIMSSITSNVSVDLPTYTLLNTFIKHMPDARTALGRRRKAKFNTYIDPSRNAGVRYLMDTSGTTKHTTVFDADGKPNVKVEHLCNFIISINSIIAGDNEKITLTLTTAIHQETITIPTNTLSSVRKFNESTSVYFQCMCGDTALAELLDHLLLNDSYSQKRGVEKLGFYDNHYVTQDWVCDKDMNAVETLVFTGDKNEAFAMQKNFLNPDTSNLSELITDITKFNRPSVVRKILGWSALTFHQRFYTETPAMDLVGVSGAGKTQTALILQQICGLKPSLQNYSGLTPFTLTKFASASNSLPVIIDEVKPTNEYEEKVKKQTVNANYSRNAVQRGRKDLSSTTYILTTPIVWLGEMSVGDKSTFNRTIRIGLSSQESRPHYESFLQLAAYDLGIIGYLLLKDSLNLTQEIVDDFHTINKPIIAKLGYTDRDLHNELCLAFAISRLHILGMDVDLLPQRCKPELEIDSNVELCHEQLRLMMQPINTRKIYGSDEDEDVYHPSALIKNIHYVNVNNTTHYHLPTVWVQYIAWCKATDQPCYFKKNIDFLKQIQTTDYFIAKNQCKKFKNEVKKCLVLKNPEHNTDTDSKISDISEARNKKADEDESIITTQKLKGMFSDER